MEFGCKIGSIATPNPQPYKLTCRIIFLLRQSKIFFGFDRSKDHSKTKYLFGSFWFCQSKKSSCRSAYKKRYKAISIVGLVSTSTTFPGNGAPDIPRQQLQRPIVAGQRMLTFMVTEYPANTFFHHVYKQGMGTVRKKAKCQQKKDTTFPSDDQNNPPTPTSVRAATSRRSHVHYVSFEHDRHIDGAASDYSYCRKRRAVVH